MNVNSNNNLDSDAIVSNPLLASFRRNNDIQDNNSPSRNHQTTSIQQRSSNAAAALPSNVVQNKSSLAQNRERRRPDVNAVPVVPATAAVVGGSSMDDELQQHIDSIRTIFETLMKERSGGTVAATTASVNEFQTPANLLQSLLAATSSSSIGPSTFAVQQQQLTISLLSCQQQLQLQQMEMRYLQQLCHDLMNFHQLQRTPMSDPSTDMIQSQATVGVGHQQPARSRSASFAQASGNHPAPGL